MNLIIVIILIHINEDQAQLQATMLDKLIVKEPQIIDLEAPMFTKIANLIVNKLSKINPLLWHMTPSKTLSKQIGNL